MRFFFGFATPASGVTTSATRFGGGAVVSWPPHGGRSARYIAPAPTTRPMTSPIPSEPRTLSTLYHAAPRPAAAVWITAGAIATIYGWQLVLVAAGMVPLAAAALSSRVTAVLVLVAARPTGT